MKQIIRLNHVIYRGNAERDFIRFLCLRKPALIYLYVCKFCFYMMSVFHIWSYEKYKVLFWEKVVQHTDSTGFKLFAEAKQKKMAKWFSKYQVEHLVVCEYLPHELLDTLLKDHATEEIYGIDMTSRKLEDVAELTNLSQYQTVGADVTDFASLSNEKLIYAYGKIKTLKEFKKFTIGKALIILGCCAFYAGCLVLFSFLYAKTTFDLALFISYLKDWKVLLFNFLPVLLFLIVAYLLTNRLWLSTLIVGLPIYVLVVANIIKLTYRDSPVVFSDLWLLTESNDMAGKYGIGITKYQLLVLVCIFIFAYLCRKYVRIKMYQKKTRILTLLISVVAVVVTFTNYVLNSNYYDTAGDVNVINQWSATQQYARRGVIYPFFYSYTYAFDTEPAGYDASEAKFIYESYEDADIPEDQKVNIVTIMLESYNDFSKFDLDFNVDVYGPFESIKENAYSGELVTNIFGGGTIDTERAFLTGIKDLPSFKSSTNSYVWYLKNQGYYTEAMHPCYGWFYDRRNIDTYLGFDNFYYLENYYGEIVSDEALFEDVINHYEEHVSSSSQPYFSFTVTYQNHGPYAYGPLDEVEYLVKEDSYNEETYYNANNYFRGVADTNVQLQKLIAYFESREEPVVVVLFGDHNPMLGENLAGYSMLNINLDLDTDEGFYNYYSTPYIIWGNQGAKETFGVPFLGEGEKISPNYLMNTLFEYLGFDGSGYMQYTGEIMDRYPVIHDIAKVIDGELFRELSEADIRRLEEMEFVSYYYGHTFDE